MRYDELITLAGICFELVTTVGRLKNEVTNSQQHGVCTVHVAKQQTTCVSTACQQQTKNDIFSNFNLRVF